MTKRNLVLEQAWENKAIEWTAGQIKQNGLSRQKCGILQLSAEYSGSMGQRLAHLLSLGDEPLNIEVISIPYTDEFPVEINPDNMDPYDTLIVVDSGCMSGRNFTAVKTRLNGYGFEDNDLLFCSLVCNFDSIFTPDICPLYFDGQTTMPHFWWESKTTRFDHK